MTARIAAVTQRIMLMAMERDPMFQVKIAVWGQPTGHLTISHHCYIGSEIKGTPQVVSSSIVTEMCFFISRPASGVCKN